MDKKEKEKAKRFWKERLAQESLKRIRPEVKHRRWTGPLLWVLLILFFIFGLIVWWNELAELWNETVGEAIKDLVRALT